MTFLQLNLEGGRMSWTGHHRDDFPTRLWGDAEDPSASLPCAIWLPIALDVRANGPESLSQRGKRAVFRQLNPAISTPDVRPPVIKHAWIRRKPTQSHRIPLRATSSTTLDPKLLIPLRGGTLRPAERSCELCCLMRARVSTRWEKYACISTRATRGSPNWEGYFNR
jgi:hypothetical protein